MPEGGCLCGKLSISLNGEPQMKVVCYCTDCRKISGSAFSTNLFVTRDSIKVSGTPKQFSKTADSGNKITSFFCGDCGTTVFRDSDSFPTMSILKVGILDGNEALENAKPGLEIFTKNRTTWTTPIDGAESKYEMP